MTPEVNINVNILSWAITRAGYELHEFTAKVPNLQDWLNGDKRPTVKQLEDFSQKVHLPFGYFFLSEPLKGKLPIPYFGTLNEYVSIMDIFRQLGETF
jgi:hypothetical protein